MKGCSCGGARSEPTGNGCQSIWTNTPVKRPDLAIHSQLEDLRNGTAPTWDNRDIVTNYWNPFRLKDEAEVTIRNLSGSVPAINAVVHYYTAPFGIGTRRTLKLSKRVNVPPATAITLTFPLYQNTLDGDPRVGVHFVIAHPYDENALNNEGSQVHDGGFSSESGRDFTVQIPVMNDATVGREIHLSVMPTDMLAAITPAVLTLGAFEQAVATLHVQIPAYFTGTPDAFVSQSVTAVGRLATGELIGGATRLIRIDD